MFGEKLCPRCARRLPESAFNADRHMVSGKSSRCKECLGAINRAYYHSDVMRARRRWQAARVRRGVGHDRRVRKENTDRIKQEMLAAYGGVCACCGEWRPRFLTIEHVNKDGARHRGKSRRGGMGLYRLLKKRGWPTDGYELLCMNCNFASYRQPCPHVLEAAAAALCA